MRVGMCMLEVCESRGLVRLCMDGSAHLWSCTELNGQVVFLPRAHTEMSPSAARWLNLQPSEATPAGRAAHLAIANASVER